GLVSGDDLESFRVPGRTLDEVVSSLGLRRLDLIKIDIEGAELDVLRAAQQVMCELRPLVICEYGTNTWPKFGASKESLLRLLEERNYRVGVFDPEANRVMAVNNDIWKSAYANLLLIPLGREHRDLNVVT